MRDWKKVGIITSIIWIVIIIFLWASNSSSQKKQLEEAKQQAIREFTSNLGDFLYFNNYNDMGGNTAYWQNHIVKQATFQIKENDGGITNSWDCDTEFLNKNYSVANGKVGNKKPIFICSIASFGGAEKTVNCNCYYATNP